jgi:hypothetical protein
LRYSTYNKKSQSILYLSFVLISSNLHFIVHRLIRRSKIAMIKDDVVGLLVDIRIICQHCYSDRTFSDERFDVSFTIYLEISHSSPCKAVGYPLLICSKISSFSLCFTTRPRNRLDWFWQNHTVLIHLCFKHSNFL